MMDVGKLENFQPIHPNDALGMFNEMGINIQLTDKLNYSLIGLMYFMALEIADLRERVAEVENGT